MFVFKNGYTESRAEWSELSCKTQPFETVAEKYPSSDVSTILLTDVNIYSDHTEKPKESPTLYTQLQQPRRKTSSRHVATKRLRTRSAFRHDGQSLMASVGESQVVEKKQVWIDTCLSCLHGVKDIEGCYRNVKTWCCYNSYCPPYVRSQTSSPSFSRTVSDAYGAWSNQLAYA